MSRGRSLKKIQILKKMSLEHRISMPMGLHLVIGQQDKPT